MVDMNKAFFLHVEDRDPRWHVLSAKGKVLGRLATIVADLLRGKGKPTFTSHTDSGDYVIVTDCADVDLTGNKWEDKTYVRYSGYKSGLKTRTARELHAKDPAELIYQAVKGMLPKNKLNRQVIKKLRAYAGSEHPHIAQMDSQ
jgi:large subunit ribosomal protein L13